MPKSVRERMRTHFENLKINDRLRQKNKGSSSYYGKALKGNENF